MYVGTGCSGIIVLFFKNFQNIATSPTALGRNWLYIKWSAMTVHSHCAQSFKDLLQRYVGEGWVAVDC